MSMFGPPGVPPPNPDPQLEGEHLRTPKDRLLTFVFGVATFTLVVVLAAVVLSLV